MSFTLLLAQDRNVNTVFKVSSALACVAIARDASTTKCTVLGAQNTRVGAEGQIKSRMSFALLQHEIGA